MKPPYDKLSISGYVFQNGIFENPILSNDRQQLNFRSLRNNYFERNKRAVIGIGVHGGVGGSVLRFPLLGQ